MAKAGVFFDYFNGTTLDSSKWYTSAPPPPPTPDPNTKVTVSGGKLTIVQGTTPITLQSQAAHDWTNTSLVIGACTGPFRWACAPSELVNDGTNLKVLSNFSGTTHATVAYNATTMKFFKFVGTATTSAYYWSTDNITYTLIGSANVNPNTNYPFVINVNQPGTFTMEAVNPVPPTIEIVSPGDLTTLTTSTPSLVVKGTDPQGDTIIYQIQISTSSGFTTLHTDTTSGVNAGWSGTSPYASATNVTYTVQTPLTTGSVTYYWRARAKDPTGSDVWSSWTAGNRMVTEPNPPTVTSGTSSAIGATVATTSGDVTNDGGATITERGVAYATTANPTTANSKKTATGTTGPFNASLTGLTANTVYNWRAYAINSKATSYGSNQTFTTLPTTSTITSISNVTHNSSTVNVNVPAGGGATITERGIVYSTTANPTTANTKIQSGTGAGTFSANMTDLTGLTTYYVKAYVINSQGISYSDQSQFTTLQTPSVGTVVTGEAENIQATTASINGSEVTLDGARTITERGIVYSRTNDDPTLADSKVAAGTAGLGTYDVNISTLQPEVLYYARAYATNSMGTAYGEVITFTTLPLFIPDEGDGYWSWLPDGSDLTILRSQATPAHASANLLLSDLDLEDGAQYTIYYTSAESSTGDAKIVLQWYDNLVKTQQVITPTQPYTFTYDKSKLSWAIRFFITGADAESVNVEAVFHDLYLGKESAFTGFTPFIQKGQTEIRIDNNWLLDKQRETSVVSIYNELEGIGWREFEAATVGLGWFDIGDELTIVDNEGPKKVIIWETSLTMDGGLKEIISADSPVRTETDYKKAGQITKTLRRTQISVDHNEQLIQSLVEDVHSVDGVINTKFSEVEQTIEGVRTTVQSSGGVNLIRNSVGYDFVTGAPNILDTSITAWESGNYTTTDGTKSVDVNRLRSVGKYPVTVGATYTLNTGSDTHGMILRAYSATGTFVNNAGIFLNNSSYTVPAGVGQVSVQIYKPDPTNSTVVLASTYQEFVNHFEAGNIVPNMYESAKTSDTPTHWAVAGTGKITIQASPESLSGGGISGNSITINNDAMNQNVTVRKDVDFIAEEQKVYYSFSARVRKNTVGAASVTLSNRNETHIIDLPDQTEYYWEAISLEKLLPLDDHYDITIQSDSAANLQITDIMLSPGEDVRQWTQSNGESMNTNVAITDDGVTIRSNVFRNDYTRIDALGFEVHKHEAGGKRVFGFNGDETNVRKLRADNQLSIATIRMVPIQYDSYNGIAFTRTEDN